MEIITGYTGKAHITAEQDRDINQGTFGADSYVLGTGSQLAAEVSTNTEIKIRDGVLMHQGCAASIKKNTYDSIQIANGSQSMNRIDLIVARYSKNQDTGAESIGLKVIQGTPASSSPSAPSYTEGDIQAGDYVADMPLYKVTIEGLNITAVDQLFEVLQTNKDLTEKISALESEIESRPVKSWHRLTGLTHSTSGSDNTTLACAWNANKPTMFMLRIAASSGASRALLTTIIPDYCATGTIGNDSADGTHQCYYLNTMKCGISFMSSTSVKIYVTGSASVELAGWY